MTPVKSNKREEFFPTFMTDFFNHDKFFGNHWFENEFKHTLPSVNIKEDGNQFDIEFASPGFNKSDFKIDVANNVLTVSAEKQDEKNEDGKHFTKREFSYHSFSRSFTLPQNVNTDKMEAKYNEGILKLQIPKKEEAKTQFKKQIKVA